MISDTQPENCRELYDQLFFIKQFWKHRGFFRSHLHLLERPPKSVAGFKVDQATLHLAVRQQKAGDMKFEAGTMVVVVVVVDVYNPGSDLMVIDQFHKNL